MTPFRILSWLLILFACFYGIGSYPLFDDNEGLYAAIARDMLSSGQFIIPHLNGMPYIEKPPMLYWLMATSMAMFGVNEGAVRLIPALALFATACMTKRFITRTTQSEATGFLAAIIMVTSLPILAMGRMILCDMIMTCFLTAALMCFCEWWSNPRKLFLHGFYAFLALAVLTKGFVPLIIAGGTIVVFLRWQRVSFLETCKKMLAPTSIAIFLLIAAPWHIAASLQEPGFAYFYFINEQLMRFFNKRVPHDYYTGPAWYYIPRLFGYLLPWSWLLVLLIRRTVHSPFPYPVLRHFLWSWFLFALFFFSSSGGKANYYMLPGAPPLIMLLALQIKYRADIGKFSVRWLSAGAFLSVSIAVILMRSFCTEFSGDLYPACEAVSPWVIWSILAYTTLGILLSWRVSTRWLAPILGANIGLLLPLLIAGTNIAGEYQSQKSVADYLVEHHQPQVAMYQEFESLSSMAFYMHTPLLMVDSQSADLLYGQHHPEGKPYFMTLTQWAARTPSIPMIVLTNRLTTALNILHANHVNLLHVCIEKRFERVAILAICPQGKL